MSDYNEIISWLRLAQTEGIGTINFTKLINEYQTADEALQFLQSRGYLVGDAEDAEKEAETAEKLDIHIILKKDSLYPARLSALRDAPPILYAKGQLNLLSASPVVAIVGSRNASLNGRQFTENIAFDLTERGVLIISGMARGIDAAAHIGALKAKDGHGATIAVLGTGVDKIYPPENRDLYMQIAEQGLLLSEMPLNSAALSGSFPRRNRIISGLSNGVLVTEASEKSGSLITARFAVEQKKTLFAVPGNPNDTRAAGPNRLLRSGAIWTETATDIINAINNADNCMQSINDKVLQQDLFTKPLDNLVKTVDIPKDPQNRIEELLSIEPADIDEVIRVSGLDTATVMMQILDLEMSGKIVRLPGNKIVLKTGK